MRGCCNEKRRYLEICIQTRKGDYLPSVEGVPMTKRSVARALSDCRLMVIVTTTFCNASSASFLRLIVMRCILDQNQRKQQRNERDGEMGIKGYLRYIHSSFKSSSCYYCFLLEIYNIQIYKRRRDMSIMQQYACNIVIFVPVTEQ